MSKYIPWWKSQAQFKENKAVVKLYEGGQFVASINTPSAYWPLNGPYEVFHTENTSHIISDPLLYKIFDSVEYLIGHCYTNSETMADLLHKAGYKTATTYCGWAFIGESIPIHHCWVVLTNEEGQKAVLDLSCDAYKMTLWFIEQEKAGIQFPSSRDRLVAWTEYAKKNLSNSERCHPVGCLPPSHLYIGCPCSPDYGIMIYRRLVNEYPGHLCEKTVNSQGYNPVHWKLKQKGLMP